MRGEMGEGIQEVAETSNGEVEGMEIDSNEENAIENSEEAVVKVGVELEDDMGSES